MKKPPIYFKRCIKQNFYVFALSFKIRFNQASLRALIKLYMTIIFIPSRSKLSIAESLVTLSFPFHKKVQIVWFTCLIMCNGVGSNEDM